MTEALFSITTNNIDTLISTPLIEVEINKDISISGGKAIWGEVDGDINNQQDLISKIDNTINTSLEPINEAIDALQSSIIISNAVPNTPSMGQYWDEISISKEPLAQWYWNGIYWIERFDRILHLPGWNNFPMTVPLITSASGILIKTFHSTTTGGSLNSINNYYEYRLGNFYTGNAVQTTTIASNYSKTPGNRVNYITQVDTVFLNELIGLNINFTKYGDTDENPNYSGHSICYRCIR
ncbi:hypothetical protein [Anabaena sp. PCC 7108]|uniref:hypothetical protein n=1 Tax=Anabaena sp. PCC 7108 TaxID=163908 RepID=UPI0003488D2F|nr:hypothetical protein [Anabaena sp. PCC 7108]